METKYLTTQELERFNSKWKKVNDCHVWQAHLDKDGYGTFFFRRLNRRAPRVAWYLLNGDIPDGLVVNHTCRNRACVNPQHLQLLTPRENSLRDSCSVGYINSQKTHCKRGHPFDKKYGKQRYCSICENAKSRRLQKKWASEDTLNI